jgi:hypothetical protein
MRYQLVLQWPNTPGLGDYDALIEIENLLMDKLGDPEMVDGHDVGMGEMNIFLLTDDPQGCFDKVRAILECHSAWTTIRVGYREISQDEFVILFPKNLTKFAVA